MNKNSIIESIQNIAGVESVSNLCITTESEKSMCVAIHLMLTPEEVALRYYNSLVKSEKINDETTTFDFVNKITNESVNLYSLLQLNSTEFDASKLAEISLLCDAMSIHYGIDLNKEKEAVMLKNEQRTNR